MVEVVHKRLDNGCGIIDLGLQQLAGTLAHGQKQGLESGMLLVQDA